MLCGTGSIGNAFPVNSKPSAPSYVNEPSKLNPCRNVCYLYVLTKEQGKETWALPIKKLAKAFDDYFLCRKTLFQNTPELSTPMCPPRKLLNNTKTVSINKILSITNFAHDFDPATLEEHPINNNDLDRVRLLNTCCITQKVRC